MRVLACLPLVLLLLVLLAVPAAEGQYVSSGYVPSYGYGYAPVNQKDGAYHYHAEQLAHNGYPYFPAGWYKWTGTGWWLRGYGYFYPPAAAAAPAPAYAPGWQGQLLDLAAARDKVEGKLRLAQQDQQAYLNAVNALGLTGNFRLPAYGTLGYGQHLYGLPRLTGTGSLTLGSYGASGNTVYGYSYNSIKDVYGDTNLNALYQQAARLTQNAQTLAGQATGDFHGLVGEEGKNRARVAEILAQAQAAKTALDAAKPQARTTQETRTFTFQLGADGKLTPAAPADGNAPPARTAPGAFAALATARCAACHSGQKKEGGFDVAAYSGLSLADKAKVWQRLLTPDKDKRMPKDAAPLTAEEVQLFVSN